MNETPTVNKETQLENEVDSTAINRQQENTPHDDSYFNSTMKQAVKAAPTRKKSSAVSYFILFILTAGLIGILFTVDFGQGAVLSINSKYIEGPRATTSSTPTSYKSPSVVQQSPALKTYPYRYSCPPEQIKLVTDSTTLNGATVSCWPNTTSGEANNSSDDTVPVRSVVCPTGMTKRQEGTASAKLNEVSVSCHR